jgi:hypothetical protein
MNATNQGGNQRECYKREASRAVPHLIPVTVKRPAPMAKWEIKPDPIELHHDDDRVEWNLDWLRSEYKTATKFEIRFTSARGHVGPIVLEKAKGPFTTPPGPSGVNLGVKGRNHDWGCYTYEIWVYYTDDDGAPIETAIDPQIDSLAPPPPPPNPIRCDPDGEDRKPGDRQG